MIYWEEIPLQEKMCIKQNEKDRVERYEYLFED